MSNIVVFGCVLFLALVFGWNLCGWFVRADAEQRKILRAFAIDHEADRMERDLYARWWLS